MPRRALQHRHWVGRPARHGDDHGLAGKHVAAHAGPQYRDGKAVRPWRPGRADEEPGLVGITSRREAYLHDRVGYDLAARRRIKKNVKGRAFCGDLRHPERGRACRHPKLGNLHHDREFAGYLHIPGGSAFQEAFNLSSCLGTGPDLGVGGPERALHQVFGVGLVALVPDEELLMPLLAELLSLDPPMILKADSCSPRSDPVIPSQETALTRCSR